MFVFSSHSFEQHEFVSFAEDTKSGLRAIIAVHNSNLGPAVGGCRMFPYEADDHALYDVLRLSRGMTYKSALAGLPMGGGKAVIIGDHRTQKTPELLQAMAEFIDQQQGKYVTAEDSGTSVADMQVMAEFTDHVSGLNSVQEFGGDPSPFTAYGVYCGIQAALNFKTGSDDLNGVRVAIQGVGSVGYYLCKQLLENGAEVLVSDVNLDNLSAAKKLGVTVVPPDQILSADVDVLAPCAMGAIINSQSILNFRAPIIVGAANNQLADAEHADILNQKGILYAPDFVVNAGGIIEIHHQNIGSMEKSRNHIARISDTLTSIFKLSEEQQVSTVAVAEQMAEQKFMSTPSISDAA